MRRTPRRVIALITLLGLLFFQGAVAAHACSMVLNPSGTLVPAASINALPDDCAGMMDKAGAALCLKHCGQGNDANNTAASVDVPSPALTAFLVVEPATMEACAISRARSRPAAHGTSPPPLLLSQRLRI